MVEGKFLKILSTYNIEQFNSVGEEFDPDYRAIMSQNSNKKENIILEEFEKGYKINDKIIRHLKLLRKVNNERLLWDIRS